MLTVNHVYEILALVTQGNSWQQALLSALPDRKGGPALQPDLREGEEGREETIAENNAASEEVHINPA